MAKGNMSSQSQNVAKGGSSAAGAMSKNTQGRSQPASRRPTKSAASNVLGGPGGAGSGGILRFYTDDAPGLKIGPVTVLVTSLIYIACVVLLHISAKLTR